MRELKFRAWDGTRLLPAYSINNNGHITYSVEYDLFIKAGYMTTSDTARLTVMQYTGLFDKNGVEIYEGDIIGYYGENYLVRWFYYNEEQFKTAGTSSNYPNRAPAIGLGFEPIKDTEYNHKDFKLCYFSDRFEVIGNIHENSDLITKN